MRHLFLLIATTLLFSCCSQKNKTNNAGTKSTTNENSAMMKTETENTSSSTEKMIDHNAFTTLLKKYVTADGVVDYKGFKKEQAKLQAYITSLSENMPTDNSSKKEKLAYWINAYNAMTVDLIVRNYPLKSIKDINDPWEQKLWTLDGNKYDLETIEHEILRKMNEPRIHFAIVCASFSCPKLDNQAFTADKLEAQLTRVTKAFLADKNRNEISEKSIKISKIFDWFSKDFTENRSLIDFLNQYSEVTISPKAKKRFKDYNWALNE